MILYAIGTMLAIVVGYAYYDETKTKERDEDIQKMYKENLAKNSEKR